MTDLYIAKSNIYDIQDYFTSQALPLSSAFGVKRYSNGLTLALFALTTTVVVESQIGAVVSVCKSNSSNIPVAEPKLATPDFEDKTGIGEIVSPESDEERREDDPSNEQGEGGDAKKYVGSSDSGSGSGSESKESSCACVSSISKKKSMENPSKGELEGAVACLKAETAHHEASSEPTHGSAAPVVLLMSSSKRGPNITVKIGDGVLSIVEEEETRLQQEALGRIFEPLVRDVILGMCTITHANSVNIELLHGQGGIPVYLNVNKVLHPHYNRPFDENFKAWGKEFYNLATDESYVLEKHRTYLKTVSRAQFRESLTVTFQSMAHLYLVQKDGDEMAKGESSACLRQFGRKQDENSCYTFQKRVKLTGVV
ncbi:hypothetical protein RhiJN_25810 [Ceratobasidium sp. AG-Ba]|nr:hypothetical protein RhiJN_25810 [Ceratobasidium sp. AG-Ba]